MAIYGEISNYHRLMADCCIESVYLNLTLNDSYSTSRQQASVLSYIKIT
jgi:hypothetical protein